MKEAFLFETRWSNLPNSGELYWTASNWSTRRSSSFSSCFLFLMNSKCKDIGIPCTALSVKSGAAFWPLMLDFSWSTWDPNLPMIFFFLILHLAKSLNQLDCHSLLYKVANELLMDTNVTWTGLTERGLTGTSCKEGKVGAEAVAILECLLLSCRRGVIVLTPCQGCG